MDIQKISITDSYRIFQIFSSNKWFHKAGHQDVCKKITNMIVNFTDDQKELFFELCERYLWLSWQECIELLPVTLDLVESEKLNKCARIVLFPIVKIAEIGKIKSSNSLLYQFKAVYFAGNRYKNVVFELVDSYKKFEKVFFKETDLLFLVDDFVGSGDTLNETLDELLKNGTLKEQKINVITIVTQSEILNELEKRGITFYSPNKRKKGITDFYSLPEIEQKIELMKQIEKLIPRCGNFSFGYKASESLVTVNRTPNNTFPIFWKKHKKGGKVFDAPFPR